MNLILNVLTLGMLPLWRMLNGSNSNSPIREAVVLFHFSRWGQPSQEKATKILKKFYHSAAELKRAERELFDYSRLFCLNSDQAEELIEQFDKAGFSFRDEVWIETYVWDEQAKSYKPESDYNSCRNCGSRSRFFWADDDDQLACSKCGSTNVIDISEMTPAEAIKYLKEVTSVKVSKSTATKSAA